MKKKTPNWYVWVFVILYFAALVGLGYLIRIITVLPLILLLVTPIICYLIFKERIPGIAFEASSSIIFFLSFMIFIVMMVTLLKSYVYESYLGEFVVDGKMVTKTVLQEADDSPHTWEEERTYWVPNTEKGKRIMNLIEWVLGIFSIGSVVLCVRYYVKAKEKENKVKKKSRYLPEYD